MICSGSSTTCRTFCSKLNWRYVLPNMLYKSDSSNVFGFSSIRFTSMLCCPIWVAVLKHMLSLVACQIVCNQGVRFWRYVLILILSITLMSVFNQGFHASMVWKKDNVLSDPSWYFWRARLYNYIHVYIYIIYTSFPFWRGATAKSFQSKCKWKTIMTIVKTL